MKRHFQSDETFVSFVSRSARSFGLSGAEDLVRDVGVSLGSFHKGHRDTITKVAKVLGVDPEMAFAQSFRRIDAQNTKLLNMTLREKRLLRGKLRVCPACLRSDIGPELTETTAFNAYARMAWSIAPFKVCPIHRLFLVDPPEAGVTHEFNRTWEPWFTEVFDGDYDQPAAGTGAYESFVLRTLQGSTAAPGWSGRFPLDALGMLAEFLGIAKLFGPEWKPSECNPGDASLALDAGFTILSVGPEAVEDLLQSLRTRPGRPQQRPQGRYGPIYDWLNRSSGSAPEFAPMKSLLRRHIEETWPLGPRDKVLGDFVTERKFHSVLTAADEYDLRPSHVANLLRDAKLEGNLDLPEVEKIYPADAVGDVLAAVSGSLSYTKAGVQLGMSRTELETLIAAGLIRCSLGGSSARPRFAPKDITTFNEQHRDIPVSYEGGPYRTKRTIAEASRKHGKTVVEIYRLIIDKTLQSVSRASDSLLFSEIRIDPYELASHFKVDGQEVFLTLGHCVQNLGLGRAFLHELSARGYLTILDVLDDRTHQPKQVIREKDMHDFENSYISRRRLGTLNHIKFYAVQKRLDMAGVLPVEVSGDGKEFLYLLEDILHVKGLNRRQKTFEW